MVIFEYAAEVFVLGDIKRRSNFFMVGEKFKDQSQALIVANTLPEDTDDFIKVAICDNADIMGSVNSYALAVKTAHGDAVAHFDTVIPAVLFFGKEEGETVTCMIPAVIEFDNGDREEASIEFKMTLNEAPRAKLHRLKEQTFQEAFVKRMNAEYTTRISCFGGNETRIPKPYSHRVQRAALFADVQAASEV